MAGFLFTDERRDVLESLKHCVMSLRQTERSVGAWKWVVLSLHSAFQGAMVCHLEGGTQIDVMTEACGKKWYEWYKKDRELKINRIQDVVAEPSLSNKRTNEKENPCPKMRVAYPLELFNRLSCMKIRYHKK